MPRRIASGVGLREKGDYDKAIADCTEAIRLDPKNADAARALQHAKLKMPPNENRNKP